jgi:rod shape-determining protein MreD
MSLWLLVPFLALAVIVQDTWLALVPIFGFKPELVFLIIVAWGLLSPIGEAAQWGFIAGFFLDLTSGLPFGIHMLTLTLIGLLVGLSQRAFFHGNLLAPPITLFAATILYHILILAILSLLNWSIDWLGYLLRITLPLAVLNTVVGPLVYLPLQMLQRRLYPQIEFQ